MIILYLVIVYFILDILVTWSKVCMQRRKKEKALQERERQRAAIEREKARARYEKEQQKALAMQARQDAAQLKEQERKEKSSFMLEQYTREKYQIMNYRRQQHNIYQNMLEQYNDAPDRKKPALYKQLSAQKQKINSIDNKYNKIVFQIEQLKQTSAA